MLSYKTNQGPGYARNYGIQYGARGKYIIVQDSDDVSFPRRVELSVRALDAGADLFYGDALRGVRASKARRLICKEPGTISLDNWMVKNDTWFGITHGAIAYRRKLALLYPYPVYARGYGEDTQFLMVLGLFAGIRLAYAAEPLLYIRVLNSSLSNAKLAGDTRQKRLALCGTYFGHYYGLAIKSRGAAAGRLAIPAVIKPPKMSGRVIFVTALKRVWDYYQQKKWKGAICRFSKPQCESK